MGVVVEIPGVEVQGTLNLQGGYDTLAAIFSRRFGMDITVKVTEPPGKWIVTKKGDDDLDTPHPRAAGNHGKAQSRVSEPAR